MIDPFSISLKEIRAIRPLSREDEQELIEILSNGHTPEEKLKARNKLIVKYLEPAMTIALNYVGKDINDFPYLFDEVIDGLMNSTQRCSYVKNFRNYANSAMNNRAKGYFRLPMKKKEPVRVGFELAEDNQQVISQSPAEIAEKREFIRFVDGLNSLERQVILSRYYESLPYETVMKMTRKNYSQVRSLEESALQKLRVMLE